jgi:predicted amino acid-binding ACT domain protein
MKARRVAIMVEVETADSVKDLKAAAREMLTTGKILQVQVNIIKAKK